MGPAFKSEFAKKREHYSARHFILFISFLARNRLQYNSGKCFEIKPTLNSFQLMYCVVERTADRSSSPTYPSRKGIAPLPRPQSIRKTRHFHFQVHSKYAVFNSNFQVPPLKCSAKSI